MKMNRIKWDPRWNEEGCLYYNYRAMGGQSAAYPSVHRSPGERSPSICRSHTLPKGILFECGTGSGFTFASEGVDLSMSSSSRFTDHKTLGQVVIDTTELQQARIIVDFSCIIHFIANSDNSLSKLEFTLFRSCGISQDEPLGTWQCHKESPNTFARSFSFTYCDQHVLPDRYHYSIRVSAAIIRDSCVFITNSHIAAFAQ